MTAPDPSVARRPRAPLAVAVALALLATLLAAAPAPAATPCTTPPATFPTSQMTPGMTGVGYTVLRGQTVEPFDVEILGVIPNAINLGVDIVVAEVTGPSSFLQTTGGALAGMSGSPIYLNGRLAGALAWRVAEDRHLFGMTAAEDMVGILTLPGADGSDAPRLDDRIALTPEIRRAAANAGTTLRPGAALEALPVPLGISGLNGYPLRRVGSSFAEHGIRVQPFRAGSSAAPTQVTLDPTPFAPGEGLGVALSYGDVSFYGFGTTTAVCGGVALGFGHPMFWGVGRVSLGMNEVDVIAIDNGTFGGTKIGVLGPAHGELTQDRFAGVAGVFGELPSLVPVTSDVSSPDTGYERQGETQIAWADDFFLADATYFHTWSNLTYVAQQDGPGTVGIEWTITGTREDGASFTVRNRTMHFDATSATSAVFRLSEAVMALVQNEFEEVRITGVDVTGEITEANLEADIARVRVSSPLQPSLKERRVLRAAPGDVITIEVTLDPIDGGAVVATTTLRVPSNARGRETVRLAGGRGRPDRGRGFGSLDDLLAALNGGDHENDLLVRGFGRSIVQPQDVIVRGRSAFRVEIVR